MTWDIFRKDIRQRISSRPVITAKRKLVFKPTENLEMGFQPRTVELGGGVGRALTLGALGTATSA